jgi:hypothetical protein
MNWEEEEEEEEKEEEEHVWVIGGKARGKETAKKTKT